jgi:TrmH family RNA methyltransferase
MARAPAASRVIVVLARPARARNVAAACRAMKNMGLSRLHLVAPPEGLASEDVRALAYGAWEVLDGASAFDDLAAATAGATCVVATSARPPGAALSPRELAASAGERCGGGDLAVVFGPEASGLTHRELGLCHATVTIPAVRAHPSLNLAQAVLVVAYELLLARLGSEAPTESEPPGPQATAGELERAVAALREGLLGIGFLNPANPDAILAELRALLARARPTPREAALLLGLARQIGWAGGELGRRVRPEAR